MVHGRLSSMFGAEADPPTPSHHQCEGRPPALQASRAQRAINSAVASAACLKGRPGPVTPSTAAASWARPRPRPALSGRAHRVEELADLELEAVAVAGQ